MTYYQCRQIVFGVLLIGLLTTRTVESRAEGHPINPFFPFCIETHDTKKRSIPEQATILKELGYDGVGHRTLDNVEERIKTLDAAGLKLFMISSFVINIAPDAKEPYDAAKLKAILPLLKGRNVILAPVIRGAKPSDQAFDDRAVQLLREMADMAQPYEVRIAPYHHVTDWLETVQDELRLVAKVDRKNVGVMFNLCHWLRTDKQRDYKPLMEKALPHLFLVSINGADEFDEKPGFDRYIQPLGSGSFDVYGFLKTLHQLGYSGPIELMCYGIKRDMKETLAQSMKTWRKYTSQLSSEK